MKKVNFTYISEGKTEEEAKEGLFLLIAKLSLLCSVYKLSVYNRDFLNNGRVLTFPDGTIQARADLFIEKVPEITYKKIYEVVNSIRPVCFSITN